MKRLFIIASCILLFSLQSKSQSFLPGDPTMDSLVAVYVDYVNPDSIQSYMQSLEDMGTRFCLANNRREVAEWIRDKFISFGYEDSKLDSFQLNTSYSGSYYQTWQYNVVSTYEGHSYPDQVYILGAHHDAIVPSSSNPFVNAPGADDNASGVAGALEVARIMKAYNYVPESTIKFVTFAAEELGLHGAWAFANKAYFTGMDIKIMLNNDMISYCTLPESQWTIQIQKYPNSQWVTNLAKYIINNFTVLNIAESTQYIQYSDSWAFYSNGFPAIFFIEDQFTPFYHTVNDLVATTNKFFAAEVVKISLGMLINQNGLGLPTSISESLPAMANFSTYPNPFSNRTTISYELKTAAEVGIHVFDASGRMVETIENGFQQAGWHHIDWDGSGLTAGIYFCRIQTPEAQRIIKIAKQL
jgi:bacterial leucyl aminopeptidase